MTPADLSQKLDDFQRCIETRDQALARAIVDDEFALVLVYPSAATMPRTRWLEVLDDYLVESYAVMQSTVDVDGDCAVVMQLVSMSATVLGEDRSGLFVISDIWRRRDGEWRIWRRHSTPLDAGTMPGVENE
jgi:ketosteroid isomerase-like protein